VVGLIGAAGNGSVFPLFSQIFSEMLSAFYIPMVSEMQHKAALMAYAFIGLGIGMFVVSFMQRYAFSRIGESLTLKLRDQAFGAMMRQEIGFFDVEEHQPRMMGAKLASEAPQVRVTGGENIGIALQTATMMIAGIVLSMIYGWQLALLVLGIGPLIALAGALQFKVLAGFQAEVKQALEKSCQIATESLAGIRTLSAFCAEQRVYGRFQEQMDITIKLADTRSHVAGLGFGFAQLILFWAYALCFWFGGWLINKGIMDFPSVLKTFFAVIMSAMGAGQVSAMVPDAQKAQYASRSIFQLLDRTPTIDCESESGSKIELAGSDVEFKSVGFAYPTRPDVPVFRSVSFTVKAGQKVALVGPSGSGKSTAISMLLRYYNPDQGTVSIGGRDITELNIKSLRASIGLVSQEPVLFATSIMDNIRYGNPSASDEQVRDAACRANALSFIEEFPNGFQTIVGPRGSQLSGGQKQRVYAFSMAVV
jgi:ATP-binding cassette subfamily B (MDR/TAP) protein 1